MVDVVSLLKLLKDLLPPEVYENIARQILDLMESEDPVAFERLSQVLIDWAQKYYPQFEKLIRLILQRVAPGATPTPLPPAPPPPVTPPTPPWMTAARVGVYAALAYLLVAAIADSQVKLEHPAAGRGACATNVTPVPLSISASSYGPKSALEKALSLIRADCESRRLACTSSTCPTCGPDAAVLSVDVSTRIFWATADVTASCQCWCKER